MHTIKCLNLSTSGGVHKSMPICFITLFGTEILFSSGLIYLKIFPCCWQLLQILMYSLISSIIPCQKNRSENLWYIESRPRWAPLIIIITTNNIHYSLQRRLSQLQIHFLWGTIFNIYIFSSFDWYWCFMWQ